MPNYTVLKHMRMSAQEILNDLAPSIDGGVSDLGAIESIESPTVISTNPISDDIDTFDRKGVENSLKTSEIEP